MAMKRMLRQLALWFYYYTERWTGSPEICAAIDAELYAEAAVLINQARETYPHDPELSRLEALNSFMDPRRRTAP
jgi:hypothetical protein